MTTEQGMNNWLGLTNSVQVVTGAASGIGASIARALAEAGANVALLDQNLAGCESLEYELADYPGRRLSLMCDIADEQSVRQAACKVEEELGPCQGLVNGAGTGQGCCGPGAG